MKQHNAILIIFSIIILSGCQTLENLSQEFPTHMPAQTPIESVEQAVQQSRSDNLLASPCPQIEIVDDLSTLSDFISPRSPKISDLVSRITMINAQSSCKISSKTAVVDLQLNFEGKIGAKGRKNSGDKPFFSYPFFIVVAAPNGKIMAKEVFAASMTYGQGEETHHYFEKMRQIIPIKNKDSASRYKILIGFQITQDQLSYNRKNMVKK